MFYLCVVAPRVVVLRIVRTSHVRFGFGFFIIHFSFFFVVWGYGVDTTAVGFVFRGEMLARGLAAENVDSSKKRF